MPWLSMLPPSGSTTDQITSAVRFPTEVAEKEQVALGFTSIAPGETARSNVGAIVVLVWVVPLLGAAAGLVVPTVGPSTFIAPPTGLTALEVSVAVLGLPPLLVPPDASDEPATLLPPAASVVAATVPVLFVRHQRAFTTSVDGSELSASEATKLAFSDSFAHPIN